MSSLSYITEHVKFRNVEREREIERERERERDRERERERDRERERERERERARERERGNVARLISFNAVFSVKDDNGHRVRLSEFHVSPNDDNNANNSSEKLILEVVQSFANNNGGEVSVTLVQRRSFLFLSTLLV